MGELLAQAAEAHVAHNLGRSEILKLGGVSRLALAASAIRSWALFRSPS